MTTQNPTLTNEELYRELLHLIESYDELHRLVPDGMCHNLLGYLNSDLNRLIPMAMKQMEQA